MNKTAIKNFAIWARRELISEITYKAGLLGITEKGIAEPLPQSTSDLQLFDIGTKEPYQLVGANAIEQRKALVAEIKSKTGKYKDAFQDVIEEVAYTWFNRLIAVRFMEVNDYLPGRVRVLSSLNEKKAEPDLVTNPFETDLEFTTEEANTIDKLKDTNKLDALFQFLFIKQCNKLNEVLPELFEKTNDYTELLLNVSFTDKDGVVYHLVHDIDESNFDVKQEGQVEIIGWLYQYYNTEPKDKVFSRPSGQKIRKEDVPAATQLFTPDWIVRYMVENSLGRIPIHNLKYGNWIDEEKEKIDVFKSKWKYYLEEAEQSPEIIEQFCVEESHRYGREDDIPYINATFLDPCMGSGHILVYAFDVFMDIYKAQGFTERDAAQRIVEKNLYGLELDDRATQLAYFAVMMKARYYDRRFLTRGIRPNLCSIQESNSLNTDYLELFDDLKSTAQKLVDEYIDAKEYGSILNLSISINEIAQLESKYIEIDETIYDNIFDSIRQIGLRSVFLPIIRQAKIMTKKYEVVCTNPPYMGGGMSEKLDKYIKTHYPDSKMDLYAVFIEKCTDFTARNYYLAMITMHSWMFLSSFEKLRTKILLQTTINMAHLGARAFDQIGGEVVQTTAFINQKRNIKGYQSIYKRLIDPNNENAKKEAFLSTKNDYISTAENFYKVPGNVIVYWLSNNMLNVFLYPKFATVSEACKGLDTANNNRFLRLWHEVPMDSIGVGLKWVPYNKGGGYRKWYGLNEYVINWENNGFELKNDSNGNIRNERNYYKEGLTWSDLSTNNFGARYCPGGFIFDASGPMLFANNLKYFCGYMNSIVYQKILDIICPGLHYNNGAISRTPIQITETANGNIERLVDINIDLAKTDWDTFETSWDFRIHPFLQYRVPAVHIAGEKETYYISDAFEMWEANAKAQFDVLKSQEEELNRIFIDIYGLQDELMPDIEDKDVTVRKADLQRDVRSFISYAVGCMFGRYSLDRDGLVFAGGDFNKTYWRFKGQAPLDEEGNLLYGGYAGISMASYHYPRFKDSEDWETATQLQFEPDADNCIPITDRKYFEDDIVGRFVEFVKVVYGEDTLEANLDFVAKALGNKGNSSCEVIRNYFLNDFFKDHCKIYQKRPIYWLFDSGKQNGFKALCYMHRWNADTIGNMRVEYLHKLQRTYESEIEREQDTIDNSPYARDRAAAEKRKEKLIKQLKEAKDYDAKVAHLALSRPDIDLDDGVKVNYEKVQTAPDGKKLQILAKI